MAHLPKSDVEDLLGAGCVASGEDEVSCDLAELVAEWSVADWVIDALRNFGRVWDLLTPENKGRLLRILVAQVRVDEDRGVIEVELAGFTSPETKEAA